MPRWARTILCILLAEDSVVNQKVALYMLEKLSYRADIAANGHEVLAALSQRFYHVILMDVQMPEMDGIEATQRIRAEHPPDQQPWIIAMTAHTLQGDREWCLSAGMDDYIGKPARMGDLAEKLRHAATQKQCPPAARAKPVFRHSVRLPVRSSVRLLSALLRCNSRSPAPAPP
ncbi:MAG: response regulator [Chloroflexaceae bacterium]|nr:response regulator [Chloroflexaceae bacterium]